MRQPPKVDRIAPVLQAVLFCLIVTAGCVADAFAGMQEASGGGAAPTTNLMAVFGGLLGAAGLGFLYWLYRHPEHTGYEDPSADSRKIDRAADGR